MVKNVKNDKKKTKISFWPFLTIFNYFLNFFIIFLGTTHHDEYFGTKIIQIGWKLRSQWIFILSPTQNKAPMYIIPQSFTSSELKTADTKGLRHKSIYVCSQRDRN